MSLTDVTRGAVLSAIAEYEELGPNRFGELYHFGPARVYELVHDGKRYDSKAIVGVAHRYAHADALRPGDFSGGEQTVVRHLRRLGFAVERRGDSATHGNASDADTSELRRDLQSVLELADQYARDATPAMLARDDATRRCADALRAALGTMGPVLGLDPLDLRVQAGGRQSNYSPVPWVRVYSHQFSRSAMTGVYLVYLFAADGSRVYLSLNQGTSEFRANAMRPINDRAVLLGRAAEARSTLSSNAEAPPVVKGAVQIDLAWQSLQSVGTESKRRIRNYEDGNILAYEYSSGAIPSNEQLLVDLADMLPMLAMLYGTVVRPSVVESGPATNPGDAAQIARTALQRAQGRQLDAVVRLAIERYAEDLAVAHLVARGWTVQRVGQLKRGYDLECHHSENGTLHVEVKGTQTLGEEVVLTPNEVRHNRDAGNCEADHVLYVVSEIRVDRTGDSVRCLGGSEQYVWPWSIDEAGLTPTQYAYRVPRP